MLNISEKLQRYAEENKTLLCFGIDPVIEKINLKGSLEEKILSFYFQITDKLIEESSISAIKPNYAYFAQYGFDGLSALKNIIERYKNKIFIILDAKRGDIGKSSEAYSKECYDFWGADAVTLSPYMGSDSVKPFLREHKLAYVLCRTSNEGAKDFQELKTGKQPLYLQIAKKSIEWNCGLVVGATSDSIKKIVKITKNQVPFLIPGIGSQGGDLEMVMNSLKSNPFIHRINSSSGIAFAYLKNNSNPEKQAISEAEKLNSIIRKYLWGVIIYQQDKFSHKGENGKLLIIGGSKDYHGAPIFSILAARRFIDLLYFYPAEKDSFLMNAIKSIPEAIVVSNLEKVKDVDCVLFGIGLSNAKFDLKFVLKNSKKLVIDGDGLYLIKNKIPKGSILTPHELEFQRLFGLAGTKDNVTEMARKNSCIILKKDPKGDIISDGTKTKIITGGNPGLTKGGTGDVLAGLTAAFYCKNSAFDSCVAASSLIKKTAKKLEKKFGFNYCASDVAEHLAFLL